MTVFWWNEPSILLNINDIDWYETNETTNTIMRFGILTFILYAVINNIWAALLILISFALVSLLYYYFYINEENSESYKEILEPYCCETNTQESNICPPAGLDSKLFKSVSENCSDEINKRNQIKTYDPFGNGNNAEFAKFLYGGNIGRRIYS